MGIWIVDKSDIQMVKVCPIMEESVIWMASENQTILYAIQMVTNHVISQTIQIVDTSMYTLQVIPVQGFLTWGTWALGGTQKVPGYSNYNIGVWKLWYTD